MSASSIDSGRRVLAAVMPSRFDLLQTARRKLSASHFVDQHQRGLFQMMERYADVTGAVLSGQALIDLVRTNTDQGNALLYVQLYRSLVLESVSDADFSWSVEHLRDVAAKLATHTALTESMEILTRGREVKGQRLEGHVDARHFVQGTLADIERELQMQDSPEGDMRVETSEVLNEYAASKAATASGESRGAQFGVESLDLLTGGLQPGELDLVVAYSSEGKTSLCIQLAWHAAVKQGMNVYFATSETLRAQVRRKIISRHSLESQFGLADGLNARDIKRGTLRTDEEAMLAEVVHDLKDNPSYGKLYLAQVPRGATVDELEARVRRAHSNWPVQLLIVDYLALLRSKRYRESSYQELSDTIKAAKQLAATFDDGRGVPLVSPWQTNRTKYEEAQKLGHYTLQALSETAEAEKSADVIISLLRQQADESRVVELRAQLLKNRDGERASALTLDMDYATSAVSAACAAGEV